MFAENRFLNVTYAAKSFHRITSTETAYLGQTDYDELFASILAAVPEEHHGWLRDRLEFANEVPLGKRVKGLATTAGESVRPLIGSKHEWSFVISYVRNTLTHLGKSEPDSNSKQGFDGGDLRHLTESVYAVTRACMLLLVGVGADILESKADSENMTWYRTQLKDAIGRAYAAGKRQQKNRGSGPSPNDFGKMPD